MFVCDHNPETLGTKNQKLRVNLHPASKRNRKHKEAIEEQHSAQGQLQHGANVPTQQAKLRKQGTFQSGGSDTVKEVAVTCRARP